MTRWLNDNGAAGWLRHHWDHTEQPLVRCRAMWTHLLKLPLTGTSQLVTRSTRHIVKSCDELTVMSDGVVTSWPYFLT